MRFSTAVACAIIVPVCHFWAVVTMTATGFNQLTTDNEIYGINSRPVILTGKYSILDGEAQAGTFGTGDNSNCPDADHLTGRDQHKNGHVGICVFVLPLPGHYPCVISGQLQWLQQDFVT